MNKDDQRAKLLPKAVSTTQPLLSGAVETVGGDKCYNCCTVDNCSEGPWVPTTLGFSE